MLFEWKWAIGYNIAENVSYFDDIFKFCEFYFWLLVTGK